MGIVNGINERRVIQPDEPDFSRFHTSSCFCRYFLKNILLLIN